MDLYGVRELSEKELAIIELVCQGLMNKEVASALNLSENTIRNVLKVVYDKVGVWDRAELTLWYLNHAKIQRKHT